VGASGAARGTAPTAELAAAAAGALPGALAGAGVLVDAGRAMPGSASTGAPAIAAAGAGVLLGDGRGMLPEAVRAAVAGAPASMGAATVAPDVLGGGLPAAERAKVADAFPCAPAGVLGSGAREDGAGAGALAACDAGAGALGREWRGSPGGA
jgi:hypothetical protein